MDDRLIGLVRDGALGGVALVLVLRLDAAVRALARRLEGLPCQAGEPCSASKRPGPGRASRAVLVALLALGLGAGSCAAIRRATIDEATWCAAECGAAARDCMARCSALPLLPEGSPLCPGGPSGGQPEGGN